MLAFTTYFGVERRFHALAHNLVLSAPASGSCGSSAPSPCVPVRHAGWPLKSGAPLARLRRQLRGAPLLVRAPQDRHQPPHGFIREVLLHDVPIASAVSIGGQETALFLTCSEGLAKALRLDRPCASGVCRSPSFRRGA